MSQKHQMQRGSGNNQLDSLNGAVIQRNCELAKASSSAARASTTLVCMVSCQHNGWTRPYCLSFLSAKPVLEKESMSCIDLNQV
jgi:hypothetical protein